MSVGLVNKVALFLREQAFVADHAEGGFHLRDPLGSLAAWRAVYRFNRHVRRGELTLKQGRALRESPASLEARIGGHGAN